MNRTFIHSFYPETESPVVGNTVDLTLSEIENAGLQEVLQTPGAAYGTWSILDALLTATGSGTPFIFKEPLGQAREVKVALSGLFGRFVARAYLQRYFNLSIFVHLTSGPLLLNGRRQIAVVRRSRGDLPDWIACAGDFSALTVAEAKGCHDPGGPSKALARAWEQARRIDITAQGKKVTVKRIAVATRWGTATRGPSAALLSVHDPLDEGDLIDPDDKNAIFMALFRYHIANLVQPLGYAELSNSIRRLACGRFAKGLLRETTNARAILDTAPVRYIDDSMDGIVGGIVTRAGPLADAAADTADETVLARLNLRPVLVGVERDLIAAAIDGDVQKVQHRLATVKAETTGRSDRAGGWIIPLGGTRLTSRYT